MDNQPDFRREKKVKLVAHRGETSVFIDAEIDEKGNLVLSGQDIGKAPEEWFGDSDYEYWLVVAASEKDHVLTMLLGQAASGQQFRPASDASEDQKDWAVLLMDRITCSRRKRGDVFTAPKSSVFFGTALSLLAFRLRNATGTRSSNPCPLT